MYIRLKPVNLIQESIDAYEIQGRWKNSNILWFEAATSVSYENKCTCTLTKCCSHWSTLYTPVCPQQPPIDRLIERLYKHWSKIIYGWINRVQCLVVVAAKIYEIPRKLISYSRWKNYVLLLSRYWNLCFAEDGIWKKKTCCATFFIDFEGCMIRLKLLKKTSYHR